MLNIKVQCAGCKRELNVEDSYIDSMSDIIIRVGTCMDCLPGDHGDCYECEDVVKLRKIRET